MDKRRPSRDQVLRIVIKRNNRYLEKVLPIAIDGNIDNVKFKKLQHYIFRTLKWSPSFHKLMVLN